MKKIFSVSRTSEHVDIAILLARISIAILMLTHGISKIALFNETPVQFMDFMGLGTEMSLTLAIFAEMGCSVLILLGLGTRVAVIPLIITMLVAVFIVHGADPFAKQEMGLHYLLVYIMLLLTGSGKYSLDSLVTAKR
ncbi:DoxX family protein [Sphingobacterium faecium]|uniref:DoxX family protein n=1 Tax=Sphingobacterium faecium TaxID=34087 RepID=UPI002469980A|nr:DoxX family protein [Sphingobacterium faecium]MDH5825836.1 DoxX family protein [Sphingobacterium faecium]